MRRTHSTFKRTDLRQLLDISIPMMVSQGTFVAMVFFDRLFLSMIGPVHMAAAMLGGIASFFCLALFMGVLVYANALVAQYYGAGALHKCPRVVTQGLILALLCLPVIALTAFFVDKVFVAIGHPPQQVMLEQTYFRILLLAAPFNLGKACIGSYFSGTGRTRVVMIADTVGVMLNIPLSWLLIFGYWGMPELGIAGAAWGTVVASLFTLVIFLGFYLSRHNRVRFRVLESFRFDAGIMRRYIRLGFPSGLEMFMNFATFNLFILLYQTFGVSYAAAAAIVFNWDMVCFVPMLGLNIGVASLVGRYVGANDIARANGVMVAGFAIALVYSGILAAVFVIFRIELLNVFSGSGVGFAPILEIGSFMMVGLACYAMADACIIISGAVLRGAGDTRWLMITSISLHWLMVIVLAIMILLLDYGPRPSWVVFVSSIVVLAIAYLGRLYGGVWRQPERLARVMRER